MSLPTFSLLWTTTVLDILCKLFNLNMFSSILNAFLHLFCPLNCTYPSRQMSKCIYYINQIKSFSYCLYHNILLHLWTNNLCSEYPFITGHSESELFPQWVESFLKNVFGFLFLFFHKYITQCLAYYMRYTHKGIADVCKIKDEN